jgi:hypothetical protein
MDKWKAIALVSASFTAGVIYTTACSNKPGGSPLDAHAGGDDTSGSGGEDDSGSATAPPPGGDGAGRTVVLLGTDMDGTECGHWIEPGGCTCPTGFTQVGWNQSSGYIQAICLED